MQKPLPKTVSNEELIRQANEAYNRLLEHAMFFRLNPIYPQMPVIEEMRRLVNALEALQARHVKVPPLNLSVFPKEFLSTHPKTQEIEWQAWLKEYLMKKHGREKLEAYRRRKNKKLIRP